MIRKLSVISILLALLAYTVYRMMKYEEKIRQTHIITRVVEDDTKPLMPRVTPGRWEEILDETEVRFRSGRTYLQRLRTGDDGEQVWEDMFLRGVNLGVALPGRFPAEFSMSFEQYYDWLEKIGRMHANVVRTYTILPPEFYKAFARYNLRHAENPLYLMQGVWSKVPPEEDYFDKNFTREFQKEIRDVVDVIHGRAVLKPAPGKAHGVYDADVSRYTVAYLLGREWEPRAVFRTIQNHKDRTHYAGTFVSLPRGNPMETWLAQMLDFAVAYETYTYRTQRPVSFVNWLPLDPMYHNSEFIENKKVREYDNDLVSVDFERLYPTDLHRGGIFAAYHAYPYYPDFIFLDEKYRRTDSSGKPDNYFYYLQDLKSRHRGMPLVIAEYGLPTSRGISHFTPSGFNQGGHSEARQAVYVKKLTEDIRKNRLAGAIYFEWSDEWFKHNWLVMDFEIPAEDRKLWHNMENPEQNFGILALEDRRKRIDGRNDDWSQDEILWKQGKRQIFSAADATYFYVAARLPDFDFDKNNLYIAFDTYSKEKGDHRLPFSGRRFDHGFEFLAVFRSPDSAKLLVDEPYSVFTDIYNDYIPVYASKPNENGRYIDELMLVNRKREALTGEVFDSIINNRSPLQFGLSNRPATSHADWYLRDGFLELRLDWHLLNVSDPAKRYVLDDREGTKTIEVSQTDAIRFHLIITDKNDSIRAVIPSGEPLAATWPLWDLPRYTERLKPLYDTLQRMFPALTPLAPASASASIKGGFQVSIAPFRDDKPGAVSVSFDGDYFSQYLYAFPLLEKYGLKATFAVDPLRTGRLAQTVESGRHIQIKKAGWDQWRLMARKGHELALEGRGEQAASLFRKQTGQYPFVWHVDRTTAPPVVPGRLIRPARPKAGHTYRYGRISYTVADPHRGNRALWEALMAARGNWTVVPYRALFKDSTAYRKYSRSDLANDYISYEQFRRQIRLIRNTDYWIAPEGAVYRYLYEARHARTDVQALPDMWLVRLHTSLDPRVYDEPLTLKIRLDAPLVRITGSEADGVYQNRTGYILVPVRPGTEIRVEILHEKTDEDE